ncbi:MAG TPA: glucosyl-3-phosphoglycerate synthase [Miltoncostaeaceae bacterium]|nr:glucosyl-3-phosphoglycerate synthase [Miltoncostaeaceae bacterium]
MDRDEWLRRRTYRGADYDARRLADAARRRGLTLSVVLPGLNVGATVGPIVAAVRERLVEEAGLVGEIVVVDSRSADETVARAEAAGARVVQDDEILPELGPGRGKGEAMWKSLAAVRGDLVVWLDADVVDFDPAFVTGLAGPLIEDPEVGYVKAVYRRAIGAADDGGGRVTEICARPLINLFYPELAGFAQPLSGEAAGRRELLSSVPFFSGYAVEMGLLIDLSREAGLGALAQVDLGARRHANQPTAALGAMASAITQAVLRRLADEGRAPEALLEGAGPYARPVPGPGGLELVTADTRPAERPPMARALAGAAA